MKAYLIFIVILFVGCQSKTDDNDIDEKTSISLEYLDKSDSLVYVDEATKRFRDSMYFRESDNYISKLEEIPNKDSNAYKLTISLKNGKKHFSKILNTRPKASQINYCNDFYTVVGFSCGGPCYSQVFVFTDDSRPIEQYAYSRSISDHPKIITHIRNEEFDKLFIRNLDNRKEVLVKNTDINWTLYGQMDTIYVVGERLNLEYLTESGKTRTKTVSLEEILN